MFKSINLLVETLKRVECIDATLTMLNANVRLSNQRSLKIMTIAEEIMVALADLRLKVEAEAALVATAVAELHALIVPITPGATLSDKDIVNIKNAINGISVNVEHIFTPDVKPPVVTPPVVTPPVVTPPVVTPPVVTPPVDVPPGVTPLPPVVPPVA